jgi:arylsulfatase A-like enzyme
VGRTRPRRRWPCLAAATLALAACTAREAAPPASRPRGRVILISLDTLRADHLGAYGYPRPTSPFLDSLAARGTLFENAVAQLPGTLPSHMSIFTGLYPAEHGVYPPEAVLSTRLPTLPEVFRAHGFRTGGHSEGGYLEGRYGFARGFEEWTDPHPMVERGGRLVKVPEAVKRTFEAGLDFVRRARQAEAFFLFLHTYSVHDPYDPPQPYRSQFWKGPAPAGAFPPDGEELSAFNAGGRRLAPGAVAYYQALYDAQIRYTDDVLREFFAGLDALGLRDQVTVVITSDHGEEFLEHGKLAHEQVYHECLHVPLLVVRPGGKPGARVAALVQSIDIAPTLYELAGVPAAARPKMSGRSLVPLLEGGSARPGREAYAEAFTSGDRALYRQGQDGLHQYLRREPRRSGDSVWVTRSASFETFAPAVSFWAASYHEPRPLRISVDGRPLRTERLEPAERQLRVALPPGGGKRLVELASPGCVSPASLGESADARCLSFLLRGLTPSRSELYDLTRDPRSSRDLSRERFGVAAELAARLDALRFRPLAEPGRTTIDPEQEKRLKALGYLQ